MSFLPKPSDSTGDFVVPEPGVYTLEFTHYDGPKQSPWDEEKQVIDLHFEIVDDDEYGGHKMKKTCGWTMHKTMSSLYPMVCALFGREIEDDEDVNLDDVIGVKVDGTIINTRKPSKRNPGQEVVFANIDSIAKKRGRRQATSTDNPFKKDAA
jgi:hypothetical protein